MNILAEDMSRARGPRLGGSPEPPFNALGLTVPPVNHQAAQKEVPPRTRGVGLLKKKLANPLSVWPGSYELQAGPLTFFTYVSSGARSTNRAGEELDTRIVSLKGSKEGTLFTTAPLPGPKACTSCCQPQPMFTSPPDTWTCRPACQSKLGAMSCPLDQAP